VISLEEDWECRASVNSHHRTVQLGGELDLAARPTLDDVLRPLLAAGGVITVDLRSPNFMDSAGLHAFRDAANVLGRTGRIVLLSPTPPVARFLHLAAGAGLLPPVEIKGGAPKP
jgi:anti-anti-sigma factor